MAFLRKMLLPFVGVLCVCVVAARAADAPEESLPGTESPTDQVSKILAEGEASLQGLLGSEIGALDKMLKPMIEEMARSYGVSEEELAGVAREVMKKISQMDDAALQQTLSQLAGLSGKNLGDTSALQELLGQLGGTQGQEDI